ncbi:hypothetical protein H6G00_05110 [Leptolyngbya sp. FACHB-541]|nr:hypothetical protein [Leptolyngbya sp. FACHB-541]
MQRIADALERLVPKVAPDYQKPLSAFKLFDWESIGATVIQSDQYGASIVEWGGKQYVRRSPANKFDPAIWFSRSSGETDAEGKTIYERLITFKDMAEPEAIPNKLLRAMSNRDEDF